MKYCLPSGLANEFLNRLRKGEIDPAKMIELGSEGRRKFFSEFLGEMNAKEVNTLFESKLLLKNQQQGLINWAKTVTGLKPAARRDLLAKVEGMSGILEAGNKKAFLEDLAAMKLGVGVTMQEAGRIAELSKSVSTARASMQSGGDRMAYGRAVVDFHNYVNALKLESQSKTAGEMLRDPIGTVSSAAGLSKAVKASLDNSALLRQGWKTLMTHPMIWQSNARQSFVNAVRAAGGKAVMDEVNADIVSRPTYDLMKKARLAVGNVEEAFPTSLPEKIPVLGRAFKASEVAYSSFLQKTRADVFDSYIDIAKASGVDVTDKLQIESIGKLVNSLTGRGDLGRLEPVAGVINNVFFSPRNLKSNIDTLLLHPTDKMSSFARKQAAVNLARIVTGTAAVLTVAKAIPGVKVELDPRSSDFGKIRVGDSRFDVSGGMASVLTLAARMISGKYKSTVNGTLKDLSSRKFGAMNRADVVYNFFEGKLSPAASVARDWLKGEDFSGNKPTFLGEMQNLAVPMPVNTYMELKSNPKSANILAAMIADGLGVGVNTYGTKKSAR